MSLCRGSISLTCPTGIRTPPINRGCCCCRYDIVCVAVAVHVVVEMHPAPVICINSMFLVCRHSGHIISTFLPLMMRLSLALLLGAVSSAFAASSGHEKLVDLAAKGNGLIRLDANSFDLLTNPKRTWSASVQLTALDQRRRCAPCKHVSSSDMHSPWLTICPQRIQPVLELCRQNLGLRGSQRS